MIRVHPIHDRARVVIEAGYYADEHVLKVQVLDESGQWVEKGAHCVAFHPQSEALALAAEIRAVVDFSCPCRDAARAARYAARGAKR